jgi:hypothetical protein
MVARALDRLFGISSDDELWSRWLTCIWVRRFESGACSAESCAQGVVDGGEDLVNEARARVPVACFSNTNALHRHDHLMD